MCIQHTAPRDADMWVPWVNWPHPSVKRKWAQRLTVESSPTARSPAMRSPPSCSLPSRASNGTFRWLSGSPELPCRQPWRLSGGSRRWIRCLRRRHGQVSMAIASTDSSIALRLGLSHGGAAVRSAHMRGAGRYPVLGGGAYHSGEGLSATHLHHRLRI